MESRPDGKGLESSSCDVETLQRGAGGAKLLTQLSVGVPPQIQEQPRSSASLGAGPGPACVDSRFSYVPYLYKTASRCTSQEFAIDATVFVLISLCLLNTSFSEAHTVANTPEDTHEP